MSFYGRKRVLAALGLSVVSGRSALLIGGRRAGKTALLAHFEPEGVRHIRADAGAWRTHDESGPLEGLARMLGVDRPTREGVEAGLRAAAPLCLSIDEADRLLHHPWTSDFLAWLRWLDGPNGLGGQLRFVLAGGPVLRGFEDPREHGSPALNNADYVGLAALDEDDVAAWLTDAGHRDRLAEVRVLAGGQPALIERLLARLALGESIDEAAESVLDNVAPWFEVWRRQLDKAGVDFLLSIPDPGVPTADFGRRGPRARSRDGKLRADWLGLCTEGHTAGHPRIVPGPALFLDWLRGMPVETDWDLAISFASEDVELARAVKNGLRDQFRVFFAHDEAEQAWLWAQDQYLSLPNVFSCRARFVLVLSTSHYVRKHWTRVEYEAALGGTTTILLVDAGALPEDLPSDIAWRHGGPAGLVGLLDAVRLRLQ